MKGASEVVRRKWDKEEQSGGLSINNTPLKCYEQFSRIVNFVYNRHSMQSTIPCVTSQDNSKRCDSRLANLTPEAIQYILAAVS